MIIFPHNYHKINFLTHYITACIQHVHLYHWEMYCFKFFLQVNCNIFVEEAKASAENCLFTVKTPDL